MNRLLIITILLTSCSTEKPVTEPIQELQCVSFDFLDPIVEICGYWETRNQNGYIDSVLWPEDDSNYWAYKITKDKNYLLQSIELDSRDSSIIDKVYRENATQHFVDSGLNIETEYHVNQAYEFEKGSVMPSLSNGFRYYSKIANDSIELFIIPDNIGFNTVFVHSMFYVDSSKIPYLYHKGLDSGYTRLPITSELQTIEGLVFVNHWQSEVPDSGVLSINQYNYHKLVLKINTTR